MFADLGENFEAVFAESLEAVRGSAGLVGAAAEKFYAGVFDAFGGAQALLFGFYCAGAADEADVGAAEEDVAAGSGDAEDGVFFLGVAADEFVGLADGDAFDDAGEGFEDAEVEGAFVAGDADGGADGSGDGMSFEAEGFDAFADGANLLLGGVGLHDD